MFSTPEGFEMQMGEPRRARPSPATLPLLVTGCDSARLVPLLQFGRSEYDCDYYDDQKDGL